MTDDPSSQTFARVIFLAIVGAVVGAVVTFVLGVLSPKVTRPEESSRALQQQHSPAPPAEPQRHIQVQMGDEEKHSSQPVEQTVVPALPPQQLPQMPVRVPRPTCAAVGMALGRSLVSTGAPGLSEIPLLLVKALKEEGVCASVAPWAVAVEGFHRAGKPVSGELGERLSRFSHVLLIALDSRQEFPKSPREIAVKCYRLPQAELLDIVRDTVETSTPAGSSGGLSGFEEDSLDEEDFQKIAKRVAALVTR